MILCCGEALIDMIPEPTVSGSEGFVPHAGGAVFNTAIALGRLGVPTGMLTGMSSDMFGQQLRAGLDAAHVDSTHVITSDRPTTLAFVQLRDGQASYSFFDENSAGRMLAPSDMPALSEDISALYFGGISLACEPGANAYAALLANEGSRRAVMLDPNIRTGFVEDPTRYRERLDRMIAASDVVKISDEDLDWITPGPLSLDAKARALQELGPKLVILTRGDEGATGFLNSGEVVHAPAETAKVIDTVGAGDTFNAGVLAKLSEREVLRKDRLVSLAPEFVEEALQFGARVAAVTVSRAGANPPWVEEL